jgi:hypothetical protein
VDSCDRGDRNGRRREKAVAIQKKSRRFSRLLGPRSRRRLGQSRMAIRAGFSSGCQDLQLVEGARGKEESLRLVV